MSGRLGDGGGGAPNFKVGHAQDSSARLDDRRSGRRVWHRHGSAAGERRLVTRRAAGAWEEARRTVVVAFGAGSIPTNVTSVISAPRHPQRADERTAHVRIQRPILRHLGAGPATASPLWPRTARTPEAARSFGRREAEERAERSVGGRRRNTRRRQRRAGRPRVVAERSEERRAGTCSTKSCVASLEEGRDVASGARQVGRTRSGRPAEAGYFTRGIPSAPEHTHADSAASVGVISATRNPDDRRGRTGPGARCGAFRGSVFASSFCSSAGRGALTSPAPGRRCGASRPERPSPPPARTGEDLLGVSSARSVRTVRGCGRRASASVRRVVLGGRGGSAFLARQCTCSPLGGEIPAHSREKHRCLHGSRGPPAGGRVTRISAFRHAAS